MFPPAQPRSTTKTHLSLHEAVGEKEPEEVPTALRGAVRQFNGSWRTEKTPPAFPPFENIIGTLRILSTRERRMGKGASWRARVG